MFLTFNDFEPGKSFGTLTETPDPALLDQWSKLYPNDVVPPGAMPRGISTVLMMRAYMQLLQPRPPGNIHARQKMRLHSPIRPGDRISTELRCVSKEVRRERRYVTFEAHGTRQDGACCFEGVMTMIWAK